MTTLSEITRELITLRKHTEGLDMEKAALFAQVKAEKLYKDKYETFADYCESIGYTRQYVYMLIRIYNEPIVREAQPEIGSMAASAITSTASMLDLSGSEVMELVDYARDHTARETADHCQQVKAIAETAIEEIEVLTLAKALAKQTKLLQHKSDLEAELAEVNSQLSELYQTIKDLAG